MLVRTHLYVHVHTHLYVHIQHLPPWGRPVYPFIGLKNKTWMGAVCVTCAVGPRDCVNLIHAKVPPPGLPLNFHYWCESLYSPHSLSHLHQQEPLHREACSCNSYTV